MVVLGANVAAALPAGAATQTNCPQIGAQCIHSFYFGGGSGDVVAITVDFSGSETYPLSWALYNPGGSQNCYATFTFNNPRTTWICRLYSAGTYQVRAGTASRSGYISTSVS